MQPDDRRPLAQPRRVGRAIATRQADATGDAISGGATVSKAIAEARIAAQAIESYLDSGEW